MDRRHRIADRLRVLDGLWDALGEQFSLAPVLRLGSRRVVDRSGPYHCVRTMASPNRIIIVRPVPNPRLQFTGDARDG